MIWCEVDVFEGYGECTSAATVLFTENTVAANVPLCKQHATNLSRHHRDGVQLTLADHE